MKKSLGVRNWESAQRLVRDWEGGNLKAVARVSVKEACAAFTRDCERRKLSQTSVDKYTLLTDELKEEFAAEHIGDITIADLREYCAKWKLAPISYRKKLERLRTFFKFCADSDWIKSNPAVPIKAPQSVFVEKDPFTPAEIEKIIWATELYPNHGFHGNKNRARVKAFVKVLRYSGLRIGDTVQLSRENLDGNKIRLRTQKTKTTVFIPVPETLVEDLLALNDDGYFFWSGEGLLKSCIADWQRSIAKLLKLAGVKGSAHKFRHTFATSLLQNGVSVEIVARLMGHSSAEVTRKHYDHWIAERQIEAEIAIEKAWKLSG
jgi:integrase